LADVEGVRGVFLEAVAAAGPLLGSPELAARWDDPSVLDRFSVRGLAGHLLRATTSVEAYLDRAEPEAGDPAILSAAAYYADALSDPDLDGEVHTGVRTRGEEAAAAGPAVLAQDWADAAARLEVRLGSEAPQRRVRVFRQHVLTLDEYLITRLIELCVHVDDLAASLELPPVALPVGAQAIAISTLVEVARLRRGDAAVLVALTRRERDHGDALRIM
jgi:mycothiol maleylpyruvate isomerase-like protein